MRSRAATHQVEHTPAQGARAGAPCRSRACRRRADAAPVRSRARAHAQERAKLVVLEAALSASEYTDVVDVMDFRTPKTQRMVDGMRDLLAIISGLVVAADMRDGRRLLARAHDEDEHSAESADLFQSVFEVGRRFKIMSPDKMRTTYGKLVHALMDCATREVRRARCAARHSRAARPNRRCRSRAHRLNSQPPPPPSPPPTHHRHHKNPLLLSAPPPPPPNSPNRR